MSVSVLNDSGVMKRVCHEWKWRGELLHHLLHADVHTDALIQLSLFELFARCAVSLYHLPLTADTTLVEDPKLREAIVQRNNSAVQTFIGVVSPCRSYF
jgi:hypothetical protein